MDEKIQKLAVASVIGAAYAALTMVLAAISYGPIQFRVSEVLCILPYFLPYTTWGLFAGCIIANLISSAGILDIVFGSLATLLSCVCMVAISRTGNKQNKGRCALACLMPVAWNGVIVAAILVAVSGVAKEQMPALFGLYAFQVALGEAGVMYILGLPCMIVIQKNPYLNKIISKYSYEKTVTVQ